MSLPYSFDPRATVPAVLSVVNIAALRALSAGAAGMVGVAGATAINDGGGGLFFWDAASVLADDGSTVIQPTGWSSAGRWRRTLSTNASLGGDVTGPVGANTVGKLGGVALPGVAPNARQLLMASSPTQLTYAALTPGDVPGLNGVTAPVGAPVAGQYLRASGATTSAWSPPLISDLSGPMAGANAAGILTMWFGDSLTGTGGATPMLGGSRIQAFIDARARGLNIRAYGRQSQGRTGYPLPYEPFCDGNAGYSIEDLTALMGGAATGAPNNVSVPATKNFITANGAPDVIVLMIGTNNVSGLGDSAATMETKLTALLAQITSICPTTRVIVETIPSFYTGSAPSGGISAANATVAAFNAWILANVPGLNSLYSAIDTASQFSNATAYTDGMHLNVYGQAVKGRVEVAEIARLFPLRRGQVEPRPFKPRPQQASVRLPTAGTSKLQTNAADPQWQMPAASFAVGGRIQILGLTGGAVNYVFSSYPSGGSFSNGFAVAIDNSVSPPQWLLYAKGSVIGQVTAPVPVDLPLWFAFHADAVTGIVSLWMAIPTSYSAPGAPYVCSCVGASVGVSAWLAGDANPLFNVGTDNVGRGGAALIVDNVWMASGANLPSTFKFRDAFEQWVRDGGEIPGVVASIPCTEGSGSTAASGSNGQTSTITSGGWNNAGEIAWPSDEDNAATPTALATIAMADANQVLPASSFSATTIEPTGAMTADRNLTLPRRKGRVLTINNKTTGGFNISAIGATGTGVLCPAGTTDVYFDGTNFVYYASDATCQFGYPTTYLGLSSTSVSCQLSGTTMWNATGNSTKFARAMAQTNVTLTYGATVSIDASQGNNFRVQPTDGGAFTIANPTNLTDGQIISIEIKNAFGALGLITWGSLYKRSAGQGPGSPTNGNRMTVWFKYHAGDNQLIQIGAAVNDVPN